MLAISNQMPEYNGEWLYQSPAMDTKCIDLQKNMFQRNHKWLGLSFRCVLWVYSDWDILFSLYPDIPKNEKLLSNAAYSIIYQFCLQGNPLMFTPSLPTTQNNLVSHRAHSKIWRLHVSCNSHQGHAIYPLPQITPSSSFTHNKLPSLHPILACSDLS